MEPGLKRVARMGDGWINNIKTADAFRNCWEKIQSYAADAGRDPGSIHPSGYMTVAAGAKSDAEEGMAFLAQYDDRPYEAVANSMLYASGKSRRLRRILTTSAANDTARSSCGLGTRRILHLRAGCRR